MHFENSSHLPLIVHLDPLSRISIIVKCIWHSSFRRWWSAWPLLSSLSLISLLSPITSNLNISIKTIEASFRVSSPPLSSRLSSLTRLSPLLSLAPLEMPPLAVVAETLKMILNSSLHLKSSGKNLFLSHRFNFNYNFVLSSFWCSVVPTALPEIERDTRQVYPHHYNQHYASPYDFQYQQPLQAAFNEPNSYQVPYVSSYNQKDQVAERGIYFSTTTKTSVYATYTVVSSAPTCYDSKANLPQCPGASPWR